MTNKAKGHQESTYKSNRITNIVNGFNRPEITGVNVFALYTYVHMRSYSFFPPSQSLLSLTADHAKAFKELILSERDDLLCSRHILRMEQPGQIDC